MPDGLGLFLAVAALCIYYAARAKASSHNPPHIGPREGNRSAYRPPMTHGGAAGSRGGASKPEGDRS